MKRTIVFLISVVILSSCGLFGIHFNVHNPNKMGKYPEFDRETILLGELTPIRENFDVTFYDLDIFLEPEEKQLGGWVEIQAIARKNIDSIQIDLDQPLEISSLRWETRKGEELSFKRVERAVFIDLPIQKKEGELFSVHVQYEGKPIEAKKPPWDGGVVWEKDELDRTFAGVACEFEGSSIWFPCKDHTADEPDSVKMKFTISDTNLFVVSNGRFMGSQNDDSGKSFSWKVTYPINLYNVTFYLGEYEKVTDSYTGINGQTLELNHYVLEQNVAKAKKHFKQVQNHIRTYEQLYGEYPWYNDGFKLVESPYAGMEHQSAIAYGNEFENDLAGGKEDYIILHETGHEWFGNAVSAADLADIWIHEGFTTYGEALYLEKQYGMETASNHLLYYRYNIQNKYPVVGPYGRRFYDFNDSDPYVKGAWILHSLRNTINNDSIFFSVIRTFYQEQKLEVTNSPTFIQTVNRVTGKDYSWFFNQYLYEHKAPFLQYYLSKDGYFYYRWTDVASDEFKHLPIEVEVIESGSTYLTLYPSTSVQRKKISEFSPDIRVINRYTLFGKKRKRKLAKIYRKENN